MADERRRRVLEAMGREKLDVLVCRLPENVLMLCGYWPLFGWAYAVLSRDGEAACILPDTEEQEAMSELSQTKLVTYAYGTKEPVDQLQEIRRALSSLRAGKRWQRVGFEAGLELAALPSNSAEFHLPGQASRRMMESLFGEENLVDATQTLESLKARKTAEEARRVGRADRIACLGLKEFQARVEPGVSGIELAAAVESAVMREGTGFEGARRVRAFAQVATGPQETARAWRPAEITTARRMEPGDIALLELAVVADGYWSDRTRARVAGKAGQLQQEINEIVRRSQEAAVAAVRPGASGREVDEAARAVIRQAGRDAEFVHITGHGLGFRYHESRPFLAPWSRDLLEQGMVHSVEPGIYLPGFGGIRIEDDILVTERGAEVLGPFSTDL